MGNCEFVYPMNQDNSSSNPIWLDISNRFNILIWYDWSAWQQTPPDLVRADYYDELDNLLGCVDFKTQFDDTKARFFDASDPINRTLTVCSRLRDGCYLEFPLGDHLTRKLDIYKIVVRFYTFSQEPVDSCEVYYRFSNNRSYNKNLSGEVVDSFFYDDYFNDGILKKYVVDNFYGLIMEHNREGFYFPEFNLVAPLDNTVAPEDPVSTPMSTLQSWDSYLKLINRLINENSLNLRTSDKTGFQNAPIPEQSEDNLILSTVVSFYDTSLGYFENSSHRRISPGNYFNNLFYMSNNLWNT